jgi:hypothetical protein
MANLVTIYEYKDSQNITGVKDDARIESLVASISQLIKSYCGNSFVDYYTSAKTEYFNVDYDTHIIQLSESPLVSVTSVHERSSQADDYVLLEKDGTNGKYDYYIDNTTDSILRTTDEKYKLWEKGVGAVKVVYTAGYSSIPEDLKLAAYDLITYYYKDEYKTRRTIAGATIDNQTTSTLRANVGFPDHIKRVLDLYKMK